MKKIAHFSIVIAFLMGVAVTFDACKKEEEKSNQPPSCLIIAPTNGQEIVKGDSVTISVNADDGDGSIEEVRFFVDGIEKATTISFPYNYNWNTSSESIGSHLLKATSIDNSGDSNSDEITVVITDGITGAFIDPRDGQTYNTVIIGNQKWFAENLNYETTDSWCYEIDVYNCNIYGRLYDWATVMNGEESSNEVPSGVQGICPDGWHLPSDNEWKILEMYLGLSQSEADKIGERGTNEGGKLKETRTTHWNPPNTGASNSSGFTALPGGIRSFTDEYFYHLGGYGHWWSATEHDSEHAWSRRLFYYNAKVSRGEPNKEYGFSVRCLKD